MELKLTMKRALDYEERTGEDILHKVQKAGASGEISLREVLELFEAMGEGYDVDKFDSWDATFAEKATAVFQEVTKFVGVVNKQKK